MVANHEEIGVAPEAQWITCQACNGWSGLTCHEIHYYICAEWVQSCKIKITFTLKFILKPLLK